MGCHLVGEFNMEYGCYNTEMYIDRVKFCLQCKINVAFFCPYVAACLLECHKEELITSFGI